MSLESLLRVLRPPEDPVFAPTESDWRGLEELGGSVPEDYRKFLGVFGRGIIDGCLNILSPAAPTNELNIFSRTEHYTDMLASLPADYAPPILDIQRFHPSAKFGLFSFAFTFDGQELLLQRDGGRGWSSVVLATRNMEVVEYHLPVTLFLYKLISKDISGVTFPESFPSEHPVFNPDLRVEK
jgi:hypothetical protein